jgi:arginyl-tRNA synthetase
MISSREEILRAIAETGILNKEEADSLLTVPPDSSRGNFCLPCFTLSKSLRKAPKIIAEEIEQKIQLSNRFEKVEAVAGYLNFYLDKTLLLKSILFEIDSKGQDYGISNANHKTVVIDFSSPNIGKELAFHHMRSTMIGNALAHIFSAAGYKVIRINHLGDWGTQFGKLIVMYLRQDLPTDANSLLNLEIRDLNILYSSFSKEAQKEPALEDQAREAFTRLEQGDAFYQTLWTAFKQATLKELTKLYSIMGVQFDHYTGESFFNDKMDAVIALLDSKNLLSQSQERDVVLFEEEEDMPPCLIRKSDGSTLYATRDLAAALYRHEQYQFDHCLYVVDNGQALHFKQVFKVLEKAGMEWHQAMEHIPFGLILQKSEDGKWEKGKTRTGTANLLRDVFEAAQSKILDQINDKNPELENKEEIALQIGVSALTFNDLKNRRLMDIKFEWEKALSFEGDTGPYVQNAHVRLCSIMRKAGRRVLESEVDYSNLNEEQAYELTLILSKLNQKILLACEQREPYILAQYALEVAETAHRFIHHCRVLGSAEESARLFLVQCSQQVLEITLKLLGLNPIRTM